MCLISVARVIPKKILKKEFAWKVFTTDRSGSIFPEFAYQGRVPYVIGEWNEAKGDGDIVGILHPPYPYGFHCFVTKRAAERWCSGLDEVRRVQIRDVVAFGKQGLEGKAPSVVVVRGMRILPETPSLLGRLVSGLRRLFRKKGCL